MYAILLAKGNDIKTLFKAENKDEAMQMGDKLNKTTSKDAGFLFCAEADFDEDGNILNNTFKLLEGWD